MLLETGNPIYTEVGNQLARVVVNSRDLTELNQLKSELDQAVELKERYYSELEALRAQQLEVGSLVARSTEMRKIIIWLLELLWWILMCSSSGNQG